jgi:hypothetical protein
LDACLLLHHEGAAIIEKAALPEDTVQDSTMGG